MNKLELRYLFTHVRCKRTSRLLLSRLSIPTIITHSIETYLSAVLFHIPLSSRSFPSFVTIILSEPKCYRSRWNERIQSHLHEWSKTTSCSKLHFGLFSFIRQTEYQLGTARLRGPHSRNTRRFWHRLLRRWRLNAATGGPPSRDTSYDRPNQKSPKKTREEPSSVDGEKGTDSSDEISGTVLNRQGCLHFEYLITETYQV